MPGSFIESSRVGSGTVKQKGHKSCKHLLEWPASGKDMLISYFLYAFTGVQGQDVSLNKRHFGLTFQAEVQGSLRQAIMYRQCPCSEQKQWVEKVKVKETDPTRSQVLFFPVTVSQPAFLEADLYGLKKDIRGREHMCRTHVLTWLL